GYAANSGGVAAAGRPRGGRAAAPPTATIFCSPWDPSTKPRREKMVFGLGFGGIILIIGLVVLPSFCVSRDYERAVGVMLGRLWGVKGPGLMLLIPVVQQMVRVDLRTIVLDVPPQDVITLDNVSVKVNAVVYFRVVDPAKSVIQVAKY